MREAPLHPFRGLLQDVADRCTEWTDSDVERLLGSRAKLLARYEPALSAVSAVDRFPEPVELPVEASLLRLMRELGGLLEALPTVTGPFVLLIDDLQWADEVSIRFLQSLSVEFFRRTPVLLVATVRGDEMSPSLRALAVAEGVETIAIDRLDERAVEDMIGGMLSMASPPRPLVQFLSRHSEGNPFFVAEYLRLAVEEGVIARELGRWKVAVEAGATATAFESLALPVSIRDLVGRRLDGLGTEVREAVDVAAVIGRTFAVGLHAGALGVSEEVALERLRPALAADIVQDAGAGVLRFAHDKLRETAYAALAPDRKRELHAIVASRIEESCGSDGAALAERASELVHHFKLAQNASAAVQYLELAGAAALRKSAHHEASVLLEEAIATAERGSIPVSSERRARWEKMIGDAYLALGKHDVSRSHFNAALEALGEPIPKRKGALVRSLLGAIGLQIAHQTGLRARPKGQHAQTPRLLEKAQIYDRLLQIYYYTGAELPLMLHAMAHSTNLAELAGPSSILALGYVNVGATAGIIPIRRLADRYFALARGALQQHPNAEIESFVNLLEGHYRFGCGEATRAGALFTDAMQIAERLGFVRRWEENASLYRCLLSAEGRFTEAFALSERILASVTPRGDLQVRCWELIGRSQLSLVTGDPGGALRDATLAVEIATSQSRTERLRSTAAQAAAFLRCGDVAAARTAADLAARDLAEGPPLGPFWLDAICGVIDVRFATWESDGAAGPGRARAAVRALEKFVSAFPVAAARAALYKGELLRRLGRLDAARASWRRGIELATAVELKYDLAINELALGSSLDRSDPAREGHVERGGRLLAAIGARPMMLPISPDHQVEPASPR
jgi:tetratricopeptide (TPR) repeat protein